jgi:hypothetical protein
MAIEIVSFPIKNGDFPIFSIAMLVYQRVRSLCNLLMRLLPTGMPLSSVAPPMNRQDRTPWGVAAAGPARTSKEGPDMWIRWFEASNSCH